MQRADQLTRLRSDSNRLDVLIIGGGASGLGAAVDAAARGYRVGLIEQSDFAKGTSSRSTKLVHGGVRYLKQGNVPLVLEALRERGRLARNAPHLVSDMSFVIPNYSWWEGPFYEMGMKFYDRLAGKLGLGRSQRLSRQQAVEHLPTVETAGLVGGVLYHDGQFDDSRLAINLAQTAEGLGAAVVNYCVCVGVIKERGVVAGVLVRDVESGDEFAIRALTVINATGVFVDAIRQFDEPNSRPIVAVSQGVHLVLPKRFLPGSSALMVPKTSDGRVLFAIPWHGCVVVGTTDTPGVPASIEPRAMAAEREFVMEHARKYLAEDLRENDVLSVFAGLRPLVSAGGAGDTAALSRGHTILVSASKLITLTGGKWTTYRQMAEDVIDHAERVAGLVRRPSPTTALAIHGSGSAPSAEKNLHAYGSDASGIAKLLKAEPKLATLLHPAFAIEQAEVVWHARQEMARTVEDVLARRTRALVLDARASIEAAPVAARLLAAELGRDAAWVEDQVRAYTAMARGYVFTDPASTGSRNARDDSLNR